MDLHTAMARAKEGDASPIIGLRIYGRQLEIYRPHYDPARDQYRVQYREDELFCGSREQGDCDPQQAPLDLRYFEAPMSSSELDDVLNQQGEVVLHRLLQGAPDPRRCNTPRDKAAFTSWCISALADRSQA